MPGSAWTTGPSLGRARRQRERAWRAGDSGAVLAKGRVQTPWGSRPRTARRGVLRAPLFGCDVTVRTEVLSYHHLPR